MLIVPKLKWVEMSFYNKDLLYILVGGQWTWCESGQKYFVNRTAEPSFTLLTSYNYSTFVHSHQVNPLECTANSCYEIKNYNLTQVYGHSNLKDKPRFHFEQAKGAVSRDF